MATQIGDCSKNPHRHSERSEESHLFLFKSKNQKRDPSDFVLRMTGKGKFTKILEHSHSNCTSIFLNINHGLRRIKDGKSYRFLPARN
jgi:hypothetical protein